MSPGLVLGLVSAVSVKKICIDVVPLYSKGRTTVRLELAHGPFTGSLHLRGLIINAAEAKSTFAEVRCLLISID